MGRMTNCRGLTAPIADSRSFEFSMRYVKKPRHTPQVEDRINSPTNHPTTSSTQDSGSEFSPTHANFNWNGLNYHESTFFTSFPLRPPPPSSRIFPLYPMETEFVAAPSALLLRTTAFCGSGLFSWLLPLPTRKRHSMFHKEFVIPFLFFSF